MKKLLIMTCAAAAMTFAPLVSSADTYQYIIKEKNK